MFKAIFGVALFLGFAAGHAKAAAIDLQLVVNPIQICADATTCANSDLELYEDMADAIFAQAGVDIRFLDVQTHISLQDYQVSLEELGRINASFFGGSVTEKSSWFDDAPGGTDQSDVVDL